MPRRLGFAENQSHRFGAFAILTQEQTVEVDKRVGLRLLASKQRGKTFVQAHQFAGRGAQFVRGHRGILHEGTSRVGQHENQPLLPTLQLKSSSAARGKVQL